MNNLISEGGAAYGPLEFKRATRINAHNPNIDSLSAKSANNSLDTVRTLRFDEAHCTKAVKTNLESNRVPKPKQRKEQ